MFWQLHDDDDDDRGIHISAVTPSMSRADDDISVQVSVPFNLDETSVSIRGGFHLNISTLKLKRVDQIFVQVPVVKRSL